jgi:NAD(P)-dependent dehydrogenase (short-subunit alcohol dehydrogenase family)
MALKPGERRAPGEHIVDATRHTGQVALVTGAAYGIGRATVARLTREGAAVIGLDVSEEGLRVAQAELAGNGTVPDLRRGDITSQADVDAIVAHVLAAHGRIDILANVAGIMDQFLTATSVDDTTWTRVLDVNLTGAMRLIRAVLPSMLERHSGSIVNVASVGGLRGGTAGVAYTASKHALIGLTRNVAWTYARDGIRTNAVCPGGVATNIGTTSAPRDPADLGRYSPIHGTAIGIAQPDEIAAVISWLASAEASNVNGAIVTSDGGWMAG